MNQSPQVKVELSHQQLSLLRALIIQYKNAKVSIEGLFKDTTRRETVEG